jgi:dGTPase
VPPHTLDTQRLIYEINRRMITAMIDDVVRVSRARLASLHPPSLAAVRRAPGPVIAQSERLAGEIEGLKAYLYAHVYRHPRVMRIMADAEAIVADLFARYLEQPQEMSGALQLAAQAAGGRDRAGIVADFVAGMTDRYAIKEHRRLFDATPELR